MREKIKQQLRTAQYLHQVSSRQAGEQLSRHRFLVAAASVVAALGIGTEVFAQYQQHEQDRRANLIQMMAATLAHDICALANKYPEYTGPRKGPDANPADSDLHVSLGVTKPSRAAGLPAVLYGLEVVATRLNQEGFPPPDDIKHVAVFLSGVQSVEPGALSQPPDYTLDLQRFPGDIWQVSRVKTTNAAPGQGFRQEANVFYTTQWTIPPDTTLTRWRTEAQQVAQIAFTPPLPPPGR